MKYALENVEESARLEFQSSLDGYSLERELGSLNFDQIERALDAGCGTGLVARYLKQHTKSGTIIEGCDGSELRLAEAKKLSAQNIHYFQGYLDAIPVANHTYDFVVSRYVFEHLLEPQKVANEFYRIIKNNGRVRIVNFDGVICNLYSANADLQKMLEEIRQTFPTDLFIGRKIPMLLRHAGFTQVSWTVEAVRFQGDQLRAEIDLTKTRLRFARDIFAQCLSEQRVDKFISAYIKELEKDETTLFYNKFIVDGLKSSAK